MTCSKDARSIWEGAGGKGGGVWRPCTFTEREQDVLLGGFGHVAPSLTGASSIKKKKRLETQIPRAGVSRFTRFKKKKKNHLI